MWDCQETFVHRHNRNTAAPRFTRDTPRCPAWLDPDAKRVWKDLVPKLKRMGVLTEVDGGALAAYCQTFARWRKVEEFIAKHGDVYPLKDQNGKFKYMQQFPHVSIARYLLQLLKAYQQEFGLTPSARTRVVVDDSESSDDMEDFLNARVKVKRG